MVGKVDSQINWRTHWTIMFTTLMNWIQIKNPYHVHPIVTQSSLLWLLYKKGVSLFGWDGKTIFIPSNHVALFLSSLLELKFDMWNPHCCLNDLQMILLIPILFSWLFVSMASSHINNGKAIDIYLGTDYSCVGIWHGSR